MDKDELKEELFRGMYFDREGIEIPSVLEWGRLMQDPKYKIIKQDKIFPDIFVSTVWLGLDHGFHNFLRKDFTENPDYKPIIFETMVFPECDDMMRYCTEEAAIRGHCEMLWKYTIFRWAWWGYVCRRITRYFKLPFEMLWQKIKDCWGKLCL